ncbi:unnamed protein product (macronuclear) [Paramecium tetraurelia]|uniref:Uncharacterized protein n=1 Tax=Paramecium tetraurelia TaxID=5888 RepID=A0D1D9_PARTE|nr:uncharacterized protein GSPATT00012380001 [Paramecium tetraurelia]CAK76856.1 unnamed protein product [Paramecium tetraurelia]|eukprot:XP_001444253.1 hypothetical protein (macronuclear) [Paramecium tetraurelia strain d4-2]
MSKQKQTDNKTNEQFISDLRSLFEVTSNRHKQDKDFLKKFTSLIKKEKLIDKKNIVNELLNLFKLASNSKTLYFNTIVDGLLLLQAKDININLVLAEAIKGPCQIDKKSKENQDNEEIKLFCFQKLEIQHAETQLNLSKVLVFMERVLKMISTKTKEETKKIFQFLTSIQDILSQQLQLQSLICILILKIVLTLMKHQVLQKTDMKVLYNLIDEQSIHQVFKNILTIAKTTYVHKYYHYIFKSCFMLLCEICIKNKMAVYFQAFLCSPLSQTHLKTIFNIIKEFNYLFFQDVKDLPYLFEKPRFLIDYLPTNFLLGMLNRNPGNWMCVQNFIQNHIQIDDKYLNFTIANLAQRQSKIVDPGYIFQSNKLYSSQSLLPRKKKNINQIDQLLIESIQMQQDVGDYNTYIYCQLHLLLYLNSYDLTSNYFSKTQISCDSRFFKRLFLLKLEDKIYKYQEITKLSKPRQGTNQYFTFQINKQLKQLKYPFAQTQIKNIYQDVKQMLNINYHFQFPFITKFSQYVKVLFKDLTQQFLNNTLFPFDYQQYFGLIMILSSYSKQAFQAFIFSIFNSLLVMKKPHVVHQELTQLQLSALEEVGVMFNELNIEDSIFQQMIVAAIHFFSTFEIKKNQKINQFTQILERLKTYLRLNWKSEQGVLKQYKQLMLMAVDRFLMMNGLGAQSLKNNQSKFLKFFNTHLVDNCDFIEILIKITQHIKIQEVSKYLEYLGECYLGSLAIHKQNRSLKFQLCTQVSKRIILDFNALIYLEQNMRDPNQLYELLYYFQREKRLKLEQPNVESNGRYQCRKKLVYLFMKESQFTKVHYNCLLKLLK